MLVSLNYITVNRVRTEVIILRCCMHRNQTKRRVIYGAANKIQNHLQRANLMSPYVLICGKQRTIVSDDLRKATSPALRRTQRRLHFVSLHSCMRAHCQQHILGFGGDDVSLLEQWTNSEISDLLRLLDWSNEPQGTRSEDLTTAFHHV